MVIDGQVCFHGWLLLILLNHEDGLHGLWSQWMALIWCQTAGLLPTTVPAYLWIVSVAVNYWTHTTAACVLMFYTWVCVCLWILNVYKWTFSMKVITYVLGLSRPEIAMVFHCFARGVNSTTSHWCIACNHNINLCLRQLSLVAATLRSYSYNLISSRVC